MIHHEPKPIYFTMLELLLSASSWTERIQPCVHYLSKWPQQRGRGGRGEPSAPRRTPRDEACSPQKHKPSLTHAHLLALEQKRLRTRGATAGHKSEPQMHLFHTTGGEREHEEMKYEQYLCPTWPSLQKTYKYFEVESPKISISASQDWHKQSYLSQNQRAGDENYK